MKIRLLPLTRSVLSVLRAAEALIRTDAHALRESCVITGTSKWDKGEDDSRRQYDKEMDLAARLHALTHCALAPSNPRRSGNDAELGIQIEYEVQVQNASGTWVMWQPPLSHYRKTNPCLSMSAALTLFDECQAHPSTRWPRIIERITTTHVVHPPHES